MCYIFYFFINRVSIFQINVDRKTFQINISEESLCKIRFCFMSQNPFHKWLWEFSFSVKRAGRGHPRLEWWFYEHNANRFSFYSFLLPTILSALPGGSQSMCRLSYSFYILGRRNEEHIEWELSRLSPLKEFLELVIPNYRLHPIKWSFCHILYLLQKAVFCYLRRRGKRIWWQITISAHHTLCICWALGSE